MNTCKCGSTNIGIETERGTMYVGYYVKCLCGAHTDPYATPSMAIRYWDQDNPPDQHDYTRVVDGEERIKDHRTDKTEHKGLWIVATDTFMSGWGLASIASYVAYPLPDNPEQAEQVKRWIQARDEFIRVRINLNLPRVKQGYHLSIYDTPTRADQGR